MDKIAIRRWGWAFYFFRENGLRRLRRLAATTSFLLCTILALCQQDKAVSFGADKEPLTQALKRLAKSADVLIGYPAAETEKVGKVSLPAAQRTLTKTLELLLKGTGLSFRFVDGRVVIYKPVATATIQEPSKKLMNISGRVVDEAGAALPGISILLQGTDRGTITNSSGFFKLDQVPEDASIVAQGVGFPAQTFYATTVMVLHLVRAVSDLDQIQVIAYGTTTKRLNTGSVSKVTGQTISQQPVTNVLGALAGRMPGVFIETENGLPGGQIRVQIRGRQSIAAGTDPLFVVDGVPFSSQTLTIGTSDLNFLNGPVSPLNSISPDDIASIEVLKDADATALYGARGANGVVLITTKRGVKGAPTVSITASQGYSKISRKADFLSLSEYLMLRREAFRNEGATPSADPLNTNYAPDLLVWDTTRTTDWQDYTFGGTAPLAKIQASISGGNDATKFLVGLNYHKEGSVMRGDQQYSRYGGHMTVNHITANQKFTVQAMVNYTKDDNQTLKQLGAVNAYNLPPNYNPYLPDGSLDWSMSTNPEAYLMQKATNKTDNLVANLTLSYRFVQALAMKVSAGYTTTGMDTWSKDPAVAQNPTSSEAPTNRAYFGNQRGSTFLIEPQLTYQSNTTAGSFNGLMGFSYQRSDRKSQALTGTNYVNDLFLENLGAAGQISAFSNQYAQYKYASLFLRLGYDYKKKYLLNLNIRRDGSSRFGPGNQFGNFGAMGAGWIFSEESFIKRLSPILSFAKIRGSWGVVGNDQIADYQYLATYANSSQYLGIRSLSPNNVSNVNYRWEATQKAEGALELGFFDNRLNLTAAYFSHRSSNQLVDYPIPYTSGPFGSYQANRPALILNSGWEIELSAQLLKKKNLSWNNAFNLTIPKNVLKSYPGLALSPYANQLIIGEDLSNTKSYRFAGVDPATGKAMVVDVNGDGVITFPQDLAGPRGKTSPDFFGGWSNQFQYRNLSLEVFFQFVKQSSPVDMNIFWPPGASYNKLTASLERWQHQGDITTTPRAYLPSNRNVSSDISYASSSSVAIKDASYIRLKNIALRYVVPTLKFSKLKLTGLEAFALAQNLVTWSPIKALDPEVSQLVAGAPTLKSVVLGLSLRL